MGESLATRRLYLGGGASETSYGGNRIRSYLNDLKLVFFLSLKFMILLKVWSLL